MPVVNDTSLAVIHGSSNNKPNRKEASRGTAPKAVS